MGDNRIYFPQQPITSINRSIKPAASQSSESNVKGTSFQQFLDQQISGVKFSQHALQRLESRNIKLSQSELSKLNSALEKASQKGAKESLILMNNELALVVSVKNRTVITAIDGDSMKDNVFTNIDSAVII